jgi:clan AA aspartic protease
VGHFRYRIEIGSPQGTIFERLDALVDTGATYTWIPRPVLEKLGIVPAFQREFLLAGGRRIQRDVAQVVARIDGQSLYTLCIFGDERSEPLLGMVTLEEFGLGVDPVNRKLIPVPGFLTEAIMSQKSTEVRISPLLGEHV